ncbi:hypothetical protein K2173_000289 [Erythroxylum novogranatense]|uniref:Uncharacterized protein n=1 Tax=Erythroxylum novogranatense TaxID=1862640 RepID=A0AAV8SX36_9ROSI|nr:hypothetical protein K2173_000289 [Erythroxylum novogranatense]
MKVALGNADDWGFHEDVVHDEVNVDIIEQDKINEHVGICDNEIEINNEAKGDNEVKDGNEIEGEDDKEVEGAQNTFNVLIRDCHQTMKIYSSDYGSFIDSHEYPSGEEPRMPIRKPSISVRHELGSSMLYWTLGIEFGNIKEFKDIVVDYSIPIGFNILWKEK